MLLEKNSSKWSVQKPNCNINFSTDKLSHNNLWKFPLLYSAFLLSHISYSISCSCFGWLREFHSASRVNPPGPLTNEVAYRFWFTDEHVITNLRFSHHISKARWQMMVAFYYFSNFYVPFHVKMKISTSGSFSRP